MGGAVLLLDSVTKTFQGARAHSVFRNLNLQLDAGEYIAIMGESGSGKSTLLNLIAGLDRPDSGRIELDGQALQELNDDQATRLRRRAMGFVFQAFHVLPQLSVARNVELPLLLLDIGQDAAQPRVQAMLEAVGLGDRCDSLPRELSGGELQRVAIARALVHRPRLLLADEPTGNLDQDSATQILTLLRQQIKGQGARDARRPPGSREASGEPRTMGILVTHSVRAAASADRVLLLTAQGLQPLDLAGQAAAWSTSTPPA